MGLAVWIFSVELFSQEHYCTTTASFCQTCTPPTVGSVMRNVDYDKHDGGNPWQGHLLTRATVSITRPRSLVDGFEDVV